LDNCPSYPFDGTHVHVGCEEMLKVVSRIRPKVHIFGHIHEEYGTVEQDGTIFVNASSVNQKYQPTNPAIVLDL
jgi:Icc-related predicted phosphoesterase